MSIVGLVFIHIWLLSWVMMNVWFIWGKGAERSYESRMRWSGWLMPGRFAEKDYYVVWTKRFATFALPFGVILYALIMLCSYGH